MLSILPGPNASPISTGDMSNPIVLVADGTKGEAVTSRLFLHNDDISKYYTNIKLWAENIPSNWSVKLLIKQDMPTETEWAAVSSGNQVIFSQIGSQAAPDLDYHPFWIRWKIPPNTPIQTILNVKLRSSFLEHSR